MPIPRRILIRVIGAPLLVLALCGVIYWGHWLGTQGRANTPLEVLILVVVVVCGIEFYGMCAAKGIATARWAGILALVAEFWPSALGGPFQGHTQACATWMWVGFPLYLLCKLVFRYGRFTPEGAGLTYLGYAYIGLLRYAVSSFDHAHHLAYFLLFLLAAGKGSDMAAFVVGKAIGRHPMAPQVSPNKTWEGGIAGGVVGTAAGFLVLLWTPLREDYRWMPAVALLFLALVVTIASQVGDLVKSAFKRWAGVKDSGRLLPEFGGMIDMVDSFIVAAPAAHLAAMALEALLKRN
ncbi:MAG TPA: phosphatidate cytidylyltransferase [Planctomycetota bacterium]|nr:phosphatidate cytidylyltransferase [Planctomycetota bacterium]